MTRSSSSNISGEFGIKGAQIPTANVSIGISRSNDLTVEYLVNTWSLSAHYVTGGQILCGMYPMLIINLSVDSRGSKKVRVYSSNWGINGSGQGIKKIPRS